jgi:ELWxxDGT repeat protein
MALAYFDKDVGGAEQLWVTNGTGAGTHLVKSFGFGAISNLTTIGAEVFFDVDDGVELWTSNGTASGTFLVKDINAGSVGPLLTIRELRRNALLPGRRRRPRP